ncbi:glycoside hydrolase family 9 protein [Celeribacter arenosi]|uniref:Endoglucanase n=1 Tax=Celeribacter arenosi TaxID=792649 RepID=A0ABP7K965_9RHOB
MTRISMNALALAVFATAPALAADQVTNGTFDENTDGWFSSENITMELVDGMVCADVPGGTVNPWDAIIGQNGVPQELGEAYEFRFDAMGTAPAPIRALVGEAQAPWTVFYSTVPIATPEFSTISNTFPGSANDPAAQVAFQVGGHPDPWRFCLDNVALLGGAEVQAYRPDTGPDIRVNMVGYLPDGPKRATVVTKSTTPGGWTLRNSEGKVQLRGKTIPQGEDASSGLTTHLIDFSEWSDVGEGMMIGFDGQRSHAFDISADIYADLARDALTYFYPVRSGIAIDGAIAGAAYARPAGHVGVAPNTGDTAVPCQSPESSQAAYGTPWSCDYTLDVTGGWYDAGDHGKYVVNGGISVAQIMALHERAPDAFPDGTLPIPEASNGVPDILDEARWQLEFMLNMQVPQGLPLAGMVHHKIHDDEWTGLPLMPHEDDKPRSLHRPSTAATLNLVASAAQGARLWRAYDPEFADRLMEAAQTGWDAALATPDLFATPQDGNSGGGPYDDTDVSDEFFWAAAEMFITTGDETWLQEARARVPSVEKLFGPAAFDWKNVGALPVLNLLSHGELPGDFRAQLEAAVIDASDAYVEAQAGEHFGQIYAPKQADGSYNYDWGSNHLHLQNAIVVAKAYDLTGDKRYRDAVLEAMDYIFGRNALNLSYVTGYGEVFAKNQHSRWFANQIKPSLPNPPKGSLAGGPNSSIQDPVAQRVIPDCVAQFCYLDEIESWSTNEITINWNASLAQIAGILRDY